jgi:hypothetical protein
METVSSERRHSRRYPLEVSTRVGMDQGRTRDMSSRGLYFLAPTSLDQGATIELHLTLTAASALGPVTLHVRGHVLRVDQLEDQQQGLAVVIEAWDVTDPGSPGFGFLQA